MNQALSLNAKDLGTDPRQWINHLGIQVALPLLTACSIEAAQRFKNGNSRGECVRVYETSLIWPSFASYCKRRR